MTAITTARLRSLTLVATALVVPCAASALAQCTGSIQTSVTQVSISTGGVQPLQLSVAPADTVWKWQLIGSFGVDNPTPWFAFGGLRLNSDRYLFRMFDGHRGFVQGGIDGIVGGQVVPFDPSGQAQMQVVIPPGLPSSFIGRTLHHGMYHIDPIQLLPRCGTGTVSLTLVP